MTIPTGNYGKPNLGKNVQLIGPMNFGSEPFLISIGDDTTISFDCAFVTHDGAARVFRNLYNDKNIFIGGPIIIGKNCFIGCRTVILPNVKIGDNCIIGAGSIVTRDIPSNSVAAGIPCKVKCNIYEFFEKHKKRGDVFTNPNGNKKQLIEIYNKRLQEKI